MYTVEPTKRCKTCGEEKPISAFDKGHRVTGERPCRGAFGRITHCKFCKAEARKPGIHDERRVKEDLAACGLKRCSVCTEILPLSSFNVRRASSDGRMHKCAECAKEVNRQWRKANPDGFARWQVLNSDHRDAYNRNWRAENAEYLAATYSKWANANRDKVNANIAKRNAAKLRANVAWANKDAIRAIYAQAVRITAETGIRHEVDHFYPLQGELVCGLHCEANLQILTKEENIRKKNRMPEDLAA